MTSPSTEDLGDYRWTLSEYVLRCEDGTDIREVVAEGEMDRDVIRDALHRWKLHEVDVLDAAYIHITDEEIAESGFTPGVKGALLTVAQQLDHRSEDAGVAATVLVVVDRDYDETEATEHLAVTDGYSIESYACSAAALDRLLGLALGRLHLPPGSRGRAPDRRSTRSGADLHTRVEAAATKIASVRLAVLELDPPLGLFARWVDYVTVNSEGVMTVNDDRLLENILSSAGRRDESEVAVNRLEELRQRVAADPFRLIRGHDYVSLLLKLFGSTWGRRCGGGRFRTADEGELARLMLLALDPSGLDAQPLFERLRQTFATA